MELNQAQFEKLVSTVCDRVENSVKERDRKWLDVNQAADYMRIDKRTLQKYQDKWKLQHKALTRKNIVYNKESIERYLTRRGA